MVPIFFIVVRWCFSAVYKFRCKDTTNFPISVILYYLSRVLSLLSLLNLAHSVHLFTDYGQGCGVAGEDGVQSLSLLGRVVGIVVAHLPLLVLGLCKATPAPEVAAGKLASLLGIVGDKGEDVLIVAVTTRGWGSEGKLEAITRLAKLLHDKGFLE